MARFIQGKYTVKNPQKYIGNSQPTYRSSWEMMFFQFIDNNPAVLNWVSEGIKIPYRNPLSNKNTVYIPDIFMRYIDKNGKSQADIIEIKPKSQTNLVEAKSKNDKLHAIVNMVKWAAAKAYCARHGFNFKVITEESLFHNGKRK